MQTIEITAEIRTEAGKAAARRMRRSGRIPAVFYGPGGATASLSLDTKEFSDKVAALEGSHLIKFASTIEALSGKVALVKDTQFHVLSGVPLHADFYEVDL